MTDNHTTWHQAEVSQWTPDELDEFLAAAEPVAPRAVCASGTDPAEVAHVLCCCWDHPELALNRPRTGVKGSCIDPYVSSSLCFLIANPEPEIAISIVTVAKSTHKEP